MVCYCERMFKLIIRIFINCFMQAYFLTLTILISCSSKNIHQKGNFSEMAESLGYPVEFHQAITPDGYILGLFRIRGPKGEPQNMHRPPVIYFYGIVVTSLNRTASTLSYPTTRSTLVDTYSLISDLICGSHL